MYPPAAVATNRENLAHAQRRPAYDDGPRRFTNKRARRRHYREDGVIGGVGEIDARRRERNPWPPEARPAAHDDPEVIRLRVGLRGKLEL